MNSDEPDEPASENVNGVTARPGDVDEHSASGSDDGPKQPDQLRRDIDDVNRNLGALTSRVLDLEEAVKAHDELLDDVEDLGKRLTERLNSDETPNDAETEAPGPQPAPSEAGSDGSPPADGQGGQGPDGDRPAIDIDVLCEWVHNNIALLIERKVRGRVDAGPHWCPQWWLHPEAILRFEGLRRAWEALIPEGGVGLVTYLNYLDQTLNALTADAGPFHAGSCKHDRHNDVTTLGDHPYPHHNDAAAGRGPVPGANDGGAVDRWPAR